MTPDEVSELVAREIEAYRCVKPEGTLGVPFSEADMLAQVAQLKSSLTTPRLTRFADGRSRWVLTSEDENGYHVFFDETDQQFGLGNRNPRGELEDVNVRGHLVGTFAAR